MTTRTVHFCRRGHSHTRAKKACDAGDVPAHKRGIGAAECGLPMVASFKIDEGKIGAWTTSRIVAALGRTIAEEDSLEAAS
jgi:hypothetical protein